MKLTLTNFLCYENKIFEINEEQLTLIEGPSGKGKSTIMKAILFALFGVGTKLQSYGKTSCKVSLEFSDLKIERSKRPNTLKVNNDFEDSAAQELINRKFGEFFSTTSYIQQNALSSFIVQSPADKMLFLETFAFKDDNIDELKQKNNKKIKKYNEDLIKEESKISTLTEQLESKILPERVKFPVKCKRSEVDKITQEYIGKVDILKDEIANCERNIENTKNNISELKLLQNNIANRDKNIENFESKIEILNTKISNIDYEDDTKLNDLKKIHKNLILNEKRLNMVRTYDEKEKKYKTVKKQEKLEIEEKRKKIKSTLWKEYTKEEIEEIIIDHENLLKDRRKIDSLLERQQNCEFGNSESFEEEKNELEIKLNNYNKINENYEMCKNVLECPNCKINLKFVKNKLIKFTEKVNMAFIELEEIELVRSELLSVSNKLAIDKNNEQEYKKYETKIKNIQEKYEDIPEFSSIQEDLLYLQSYKNKQTMLENQLENIKESNYVKDLENELNDLHNEIQKLPECSVCDFDKDEVLQNIYEQKAAKEEYIFVTEEIQNYESMLESEISSKTREIEEYDRKFASKDADLLNKKFLKFAEELENKKNYFEEVLGINKIIVDWNNYQAQKEEYDNINKSLKLAEAKKKEYENKYNAGLKFKNIILSCESAIMGDIINNINMSAKTYLDIIFPEDPISVNLSSFKENKKGILTPSINVEIEYKGMDCELTMLSGGELSRIILAYTLALSELFNSPLILLDESTASLDQESTNIVFEAIKENCIGKTVIIIAHQVVQGGFENVIGLH
jgi:DNA repair exonuclease SbcCD ATPase subunit